jgi:hypothetical protein
MDNALYVQLFRGYERKAFLEIEPHLIAKTAFSTGTCTVGFVNAFIQNVL